MTRLSALVAVVAALAFVAVAHAAQPKDGTFKGKSGQKLPVQITVKNQTLTQVRFSAVCKGDKSHSVFTQQFAQLDGRLQNHGHFSETEGGDTQFGNGETYTVKGQFTKPKVAKGTLHFKGGPCDTGKVKFTLKLK
jgi:hypothetical protein